jgi:ubiquinone biosynthesis protein
VSQFVPELLFLGEVMPAEAVDETWDRQATDELADEFWRATMERVQDQLEHGALWKDLLERHFQEVLSDTSLAQECGPILDEVWDRYYELEPDLPVADSLGATFTTHLAVATLAVFEVLRDHGVDRKRAYEIIYDTGWRLYTKMGEPPLLVASAYTRDPAKRLRIATDLFRFFPFGEPGYRWEDVEGAANMVGFDCVKCPVAEFFARHEESELCVNTWCNLDFPLAEKWGGRLERTGTIASGAKRCDFRWHSDIGEQKS